MKQAVIVSAARTGLAKFFRGSFNMTHGATMGGHAVSAAVERAGIGHLGAAMGLGYVPCRTPSEPAADMLASDYAIEIAGTRHAARASLRPMYDPTSERMRA